MILRFCSGSLTPARRSRNSAAASATTERDVEVAAEQLDHLLGLARAQQAGVDEHAGQLLADRLVQQQRRDRASRPRPRGRRSPAPAPTCSRMRSIARLAKARHRPVAAAAGDPVGEVPQQRAALAACARPRGGTGRRRSAARRRRSRRTASPPRSRPPESPAAARRPCRRGSSRPGSRAPGSNRPSNSAQRPTTSMKARPNSR